MLSSGSASSEKRVIRPQILGAIGIAPSPKSCSLMNSERYVRFLIPRLDRLEDFQLAKLSGSDLSRSGEIVAVSSFRTRMGCNETVLIGRLHLLHIFSILAHMADLRSKKSRIGDGHDVRLDPHQQFENSRIDNSRTDSSCGLLSVAVVVRNAPRLVGVSTAVELIAAFLDGWTLTRACLAGCPRWVFERIVQFPEYRPVDPSFDLLYRKWRCRIGMERAAISGRVATLEWLLEHFRDGNIVINAMAGGVLAASTYGQLPALQWLVGKLNEVGGMDLVTNQTLFVDSFKAAVQRNHQSVAVWIASESGVESASLSGLQLVDSALQWKNGDMARWLIEEFQAVGSRDTVVFAAHLGDIELMRLIVDRLRPAHNVGAVAVAAQHGHLDVLQYLHQIGVPVSNYSLNSAAWGGHIDILKWLHFDLGLRQEQSQCALDVAARNGHLEAVQFLHQFLNEGYSMSAINSAAEHGHLEVIQWLTANRRDGWWSGNAMDKAAAMGHLDVVKWLHANRTEGCSSSAMDKAAEHGHLAVVEWLSLNRKGGYGCKAMNLAAENGHLDVVKWLHEHRSEGCTSKAMDKAAKNGHLDVVQWLYANRTEGCTERALDEAVSNGHLPVVKWLFEHHLEGENRPLMEEAIVKGHKSVMEWLFARAWIMCTPNIVNRAASKCRIDILEWVHAKRNELDWVVLEYHAGEGEFYVDINAAEVRCSKRAFDQAHRKRRLDVMYFLVQHFDYSWEAEDNNNEDFRGTVGIEEWLEGHGLSSPASTS